MKKTILLPLLGLGALGAVHAQEIVGRVLSSTPVVQQVAVPRQVCTTQPVAVEQPKSGAGLAMGAIAGGALGNQVGHGGGRALATMAGLIGGAVVGNNIEGGNTVVQNQQQCSTQTFYENRTTNWNVTYEYGGRQYTVQMPYDPGPTIRLQVTPVSSAPVDNGVPPPVITSQSVAQAPVTYATQQAPVVYAAAPVAYAVPMYYAAPYPVYRPYYYAPVSLSLGYTWHGGGHRHWR